VHRSLSVGLPSLVLVSALALPQAARAQGQQPSVTVSGVAYAQYSYQLKDTANHTNSFDVTRGYVNVLGKFGGGVGTRITVDVNRPAGDNSLRYRLKYAYFTYTPDGSALTGKFGLIHTPWVDYEEGLWDYRMQGPIALDRNGYLTSADFGVGVDGKWNKDAVNMQVTFVNGEGYSGGAGDQRKDIEGRVSVRVLNTDDMGSRGGLRLTGYAGIGKPTGGGKRQRFVGMASYKSKAITLAGEFAITKDSSAATTGVVDGQVIEAFGVFNVPNSKVAIIGRVDYVKPDKNAPSATPGFTNTRFIGGISYQLSPNVRLLADLDMVSYKNGAPSAAAEASRQTALFQTQFTF
jgi:hypothetical protein